MADPTKKLLASSAMVDLKAELHRKQEEFRRQKVDHEYVKGRKLEKIKTKKSFWSQQNPGVAARASKDVEEKAEEEDVFLKSRTMLAHKSRLYEEMSSTKSIPDEDGSEEFLVNFQKKAVDRIVDEREKKRKEEDEKREEEAEMRALSEPIPEPDDSDEEWFDFTDSLGRSRRCLKKDLNYLKEKDKEFASKTTGRTTHSTDEGNSDQGRAEPELPDLMSNNMYMDRMRQKWEDEAQALLDKGQNDVHYSNVQYDEIRTHGVGFYQFSKDHGTRGEQLDELKKLRDQTLSETSRNQRIKDKRKALMEARLAKVRERKKLKEPVSGGPKEEQNIETEADIAAKKLEEDERVKKEKAEREAEEVRKNHIREWDKDKQKNSWAGNGYVESRRNEREAEFAPPSAYFEKDGKKATNFNSRDQKRINRLKKSTVSSDMNPEFAPPPSYFNKDKNSNTNHHHQEKVKIVTNSSEREIHGNESAKALNVLNNVCISSIPLPAESHNEVKNSSKEKNENIGFVSVSPDKPSEDPHQTNRSFPPSMNSYGNNWHFQQEGFQLGQYENQLNQQHEQDQHQQFMQYQQHHQQMQQTTPDQWLMYQQQQQQQHGYCQQQQHGYNQQQQPPLPHSHQQQFHQQIQTQPSPSDVLTSKRQQTADQSQDVTAVKKPKVPKTAIMDMRFMQNEQKEPVDKSDTSEPIVQAVPYEPGSFTAAKFAKRVKPDDPSMDSDQTTQISGGPKLYTQKQQEEQKRWMEESTQQESDDNDVEADKKLKDFLASI